MILNLDPCVQAAREQLEDGTAGPNDRFFYRTNHQFEKVQWTGPDGAIYTADADVDVYEYTPIVHGRV